MLTRKFTGRFWLFKFVSLNSIAELYSDFWIFYNYTDEKTNLPFSFSSSKFYSQSLRTRFEFHLNERKERNMEIKRIAIGFFVTLAMAFCLSLVSVKTEQTSSISFEDKNSHIAGYQAR